MLLFANDSGHFVVPAVVLTPGVEGALQDRRLVSSAVQLIQDDWRGRGIILNEKGIDQSFLGAQAES